MAQRKRLQCIKGKGLIAGAHPSPPLPLKEASPEQSPESRCLNFWFPHYHQGEKKDLLRTPDVRSGLSEAAQVWVQPQPHPCLKIQSC